MNNGERQNCNICIQVFKHKGKLQLMTHMLLVTKQVKRSFLGAKCRLQLWRSTRNITLKIEMMFLPIYWMCVLNMLCGGFFWNHEHSIHFNSRLTIIVVFKFVAAAGPYFLSYIWKHALSTNFPWVELTNMLGLDFLIERVVVWQCHLSNLAFVALQLPDFVRPTMKRKK